MNPAVYDVILQQTTTGGELSPEDILVFAGMAFVAIIIAITFVKVTEGSSSQSRRNDSLSDVRGFGELDSETEEMLRAVANEIIQQGNFTGVADGRRFKFVDDGGMKHAEIVIENGGFIPKWRTSEGDLQQFHRPTNVDTLSSLDGKDIARKLVNDGVIADKMAS